MEKNIFDYIFLGGGCASLSLSLQIKKKKINKPSFLILEERKSYKDDRTWCFWSNYKNADLQFVERSWNKWKFNISNNTHLHKSKYFKYYYIRSINFYRKALQNIELTKNIRINLNEKVIKVKKEDSFFLIISNKQTYKAKNVLDTRLNIKHFIEKPLLYQSFLGYEIKINNKQYDLAKVPFLMKNMRHENKMFIFEYILPLQGTTALIETTIFSTEKFTKDFIKHMLHKALKDMKITKYKKLREEYGIIPMGFIDQKVINLNKNYVFSGLAGGAARASSGYTFSNIQKWADSCSNSIKNDSRLIKYQKINRLEKFLDLFFMNLLNKYIIYSPHIFYGFAKSISSNTFARFMIGNCRVIDYLKVIIFMPKKFILIYLFKARNR